VALIAGQVGRGGVAGAVLVAVVDVIVRRSRSGL
jgi:hypothetical protein